MGSTSRGGRALRWLVPAGVALDLGLLRSGLIAGRTALWLGAVVEVGVLAVGGVLAWRTVREYRTRRHAGADAWLALEDGLALLVPRAAARFVALEPRLWACLWNWAIRRRRAGTDEFSYHRNSRIALVLVLVLLTTPVEVLSLELLLPWRWLRIALLVSAVYAVFWIAGLYGSLVTLPHRLEATRAHFRYGALASVFVPYDAIASVTLEKRAMPAGRPGLSFGADDGAAHLSATDRTTLRIDLPGGVLVRGTTGAARAVARLYLGADRPDALATALRERIGASGAAAAPTSPTPSGTASPLPA